MANSKRNTHNRGVQKKLKVIPLGGLHEIGKNMTLLEYGEDIILIDCGMAFPDDYMLGIDVVIPDFSYLRENSEKIKGLIITHAHEDHIGAIPYLLSQLRVPIYGTSLTLGFIENKLKEFKISAETHEIYPGSTFKLGVFNIEAVHITHSVADSLAYSIGTPVGKIFYTGDFKVDFTPVDDQPIDIAKLARIGDEGVLLMMADSTNALRKGYSNSEMTVGISLDNIFRGIKGRIIIATFSSNVHRVQKIIDISAECGRKVAVSGRSMENMVAIASELGYLKIPANVLIDINKAKLYKNGEVVIITTGSQGEPMSALARMAAGEHRQIKIIPGDTVILSSTPVPGNEKMVSDIVNELMEKGADVIYNDIAETHVSGHACQEELKLMHALIKPKYFMPVHGEVRHLISHAKIAKSLGLSDKHIILANNGDVIEATRDKVKKTAETVAAGGIMVDGLGIGDVGQTILSERKYLSEAGLVVISAVFDQASGELLAGPDLYNRGFLYVKEYGQIIDDAKQYLSDCLYEAYDKGMDIKSIENLLTHKLKNYIYEKTNRSPLILPVFTEI